MTYWLANLICRHWGHKWTPWEAKPWMLPGGEYRHCQRCIVAWETWITKEENDGRHI